jgi:hypothetical protein
MEAYHVTNYHTYLLSKKSIIFIFCILHYFYADFAGLIFRSNTRGII